MGLLLLPVSPNIKLKNSRKMHLTFELSSCSADTRSSSLLQSHPQHNHHNVRSGKPRRSILTRTATHTHRLTLFSSCCRLCAYLDWRWAQHWPFPSILTVHRCSPVQLYRMLHPSSWLRPPSRVSRTHHPNSWQLQRFLMQLLSFWLLQLSPMQHPSCWLRPP